MIKASRIAAMTMCILAACMCAVPAHAQTKPAFMIGVWYQPMSSFAKWKARGVNTLVGFVDEGGQVTKEQWKQAARDAGLFYMFKPAGTAAEMLAEASDPNLLAWSLPDEPDGAGNLTPDQIVAMYKSFKAVANVPVFLNLDGGAMQWLPASTYQAYALGADILAFDYYVANRGDAPAHLDIIATRTDQLKAWGNNKPVVAFIECDDQKLYLQSWVTPALAALMRGPTADEMTTEINYAVNHGASGICYFPDVIGAGWISFDGTPPDLEAAMITANAALAAKFNSGTSAQPPTTQPVITQPTTKPTTPVTTPTTKPTTPTPTTKPTMRPFGRGGDFGRGGPRQGR